MKENILLITKNLLSHTWLIFTLGFFYILFLERKTIIEIIKNKKIKKNQLAPLFQKYKYLLGGLLLVFMSFALANLLLDIFTPANMPEVDYQNMQITDTWSWLKFSTQYTGIFMAIGFYLSGYSLMLSGGGRWLTNLAKLFATITVLVMLLGIFIAYV